MGPIGAPKGHREKHASQTGYASTRLMTLAKSTCFFFCKTRQRSHVSLFSLHACVRIKATAMTATVASLAQ